MLPFGRILVALAADQTDDGLLDYAAMLARILPGVELLCVHAGPADPEALSLRIRCRLPSGATCEVLPGERTDALLEFAAARETDLILMGHRAGVVARRSLARRLAMAAPCSVWMVPNGFPARLDGILAPIDFSARAADALSLATAVAASAGLEECLALHVHFNSAATTFDEYEEVVAEGQDRAFGIFIARIDLHGVDVQPLYVESPAVAHTVLRVAAERGAGLIVMGTRGRSRSAAVLLGSETEHVLGESPVPVLAVKHFGSRLPLLRALLDKRVRERGGPRFT